MFELKKQRLNSEPYNIPSIQVVNTPTSTPSTATTNASPTASTTTPAELPDVAVIASNLKIPWDIAFLSNGDLLVTERVGNLVRISNVGTTAEERTNIKLPHAVPKGEGGLLGIVLHPKFKENNQLYLYMTTAGSTSGTKNAVFRYELVDGKLTNEQVIIRDIPGALYHDGGRMEFGPDGYLYITTGDAQSSTIAQDLKSLGGKILRLEDDGSIPSDNPYKTAVYSYGHRNPQGLAWDTSGNLWETEHGRSGVTTGYDELNLILKGKNYGWPKIEGPTEQPGMIAPALQSGATNTWAPASALFHEGSIFFGGLKGEALYQAVLQGTSVTELKKYFFKEYGRIRTVRKGPDGMFYLTTSNTDNRGVAKSGDDKIIRVNPRIFK